MAVEFYLELFKADPTSNEDYIRGHFPNMEQEQTTVWGTKWTENETKRALKGWGLGRP